MTMPNVNGVPLNLAPFPNVQPFTVRDNATMLILLTEMREWINKTLVPFVNENIETLTTEWAENTAQMIDAFNQLVTEAETAKNDAEAAQLAAEAARDLAAQFASDAEEIQDEAVTLIFESLTSDLRQALDATYAKLGTVTALTFPNVADALSATVAGDVTTLTVRGYYAPEDGGGARYTRADAEPAHAGKLQTADGAWWVNTEPILTLEMFGGRPVPLGTTDVSIASGYDVTTVFNDVSETASALGRAVRLSSGHWAHSGTLVWLDGVKFYGETATDTWRAANTANLSSWPAEKYAELVGAVFIAFGVFAKTFTATNITKGAQHGYGREINIIDRPYDNGLDERFDLWDSTNENAVGATPATLKPFSVAHHFESANLRRFSIENVIFIPNCPAPGDTFGLGGYGHYTSVTPWADVDFGVYLPEAFSSRFNFSALGYYNARGVLVNCQREGNDQLGYAENNVFEQCVIQGGLAVRTPDSWPVLVKTANSVTLRWTESHTFPSAGTLRIGVSAFDNEVFDYTSLTYSGGMLTFTTVQDTDNVIVGGTSPNHVWTGRGNGYANTVFRDNELFDFSHATRINDNSPEFGSRARAFSAALEISGYVRALRFESTVLRTVGPLMAIFGVLRDVVFSNCWMEGRNLRRETTSATQSYGYGSVIVAGPTPDMLTETGAHGIGDVSFDESRNIHTSVNRHPLRVSSVGSAFGTMEDLVTLYWRDLGEESVLRGSSNLRLWAQPSTEIDIRGRRADGTTVRGVLQQIDGQLLIGETASGAVQLTLPGRTTTPVSSTLRSNLNPGTDDQFSLGSSSHRWKEIYAVNDVINTSDEREKTHVREIASIEKTVAIDLKNLLRAYRWTDDVNEHGSGAKIHFGIIAQEVVKAFQNWGLSPGDYGLLCRDEWPETTEQRDADGNVTVEHVPAGHRYGIRYTN